MITKYENKRLKLNYNLKGKKKGDIITIPTLDGMPIDKFWRNRVNDSPLDKCVEWVEDKEKKSYKNKSLT
jgi:hypothetical protein